MAQRTFQPPHACCRPCLKSETDHLSQFIHQRVKAPLPQPPAPCVPLFPLLFSFFLLINERKVHSITRS